MESFVSQFTLREILAFGVGTLWGMFWAFLLLIKVRISHSRGYQPKDDIDPDKVRPPKGAGSAVKPPNNS